LPEPHALSQVTRDNRAVHDDAWIRSFLRQAPWGVLATTTALPENNSHPQPFLAPLLFTYDESRHTIYVHSARRGRLWENIQTNPQVCFNASQMGRLLPATEALHFDVEYASVVVFGKLVLVEDLQESETALQMILDKYFPHMHPGRDYRPIMPAERDATAVYRLEIHEWSGKQKTADPDFAGAFHWPPPTA